MATTDNDNVKPNESAPRIPPPGEAPPADVGKVDTAITLAFRRPIYKGLDKVLSSVGFRHVPGECPIANLDGVLFALGRGNDDTHQRIWSTLYDQACALVRHDDSLNWQKFNNMVIFNGALLTCYGFSIQYRVSFLLSVLPLFGFLFSWLFDLTLQEGMRCVRAHKNRVEALERKALGPTRHFMFRANPWNHRDALEMSPLLLGIFWLVLFLLALWGSASGKQDPFLNAQAPSLKAAGETAGPTAPAEHGGTPPTASRVPDSLATGGGPVQTSEIHRVPAPAPTVPATQPAPAKPTAGSAK
jgi:hypothetical protein